MRLIDARAYCEELCAERDYPGRSQEFINAIEVAIADLSDMPTIDAVPVVRCKDCAYFSNEEILCSHEGNMVLNIGKTVYPNDFCSYGERKDGDTNG